MTEKILNYPSLAEQDFKNTNWNVPDWVSDIKSIGWAEFMRIGLPTATRGNELWKYTSIRPLERAKVSLNTNKPAKPSTIQALNKQQLPYSELWNTIVFVDGVFSSELSNLETHRGLTIKRLSKAFITHRERLEPFFSKIAEIKDNAFVALNTAFVADGVFIDVDANTHITVPVNVVYVISKNLQSTAIYPRISVICGENSQLQLIESYINFSEEQNLTSPVVEAVLQPNSTLIHNRIQLEKNNAFHIYTGRIRQLEHSKFLSTSLSTAPAIGRYDIHTQLDGQGSQSEINGIYLTTLRQHQRNEISTTHAQPNCKSRQFFKGILSGKSQAVFSGQVVVAQDSQKTDAAQKDLNLLLSYGAEIYTKPSLEIYADDVQCSHGATAGHIDKNALFYLQSRGVDEYTARSILIKGFAQDITNKFNEPSLQDFSNDVVENAISSMLSGADLATPRTM